MNTFTTTTVFLAILCTVAAVQHNQPLGMDVPSPTVAFMVNPNISRKSEFFPTCSPTVLSTSIAFWCYYDTASMTNFAGLVSPSSPEIQYPTIALETEDAFAFLRLKPESITETSALFGSIRAAHSAWTAASTNGILGIASRFNSTATPAVDPVTHTAFIPYGVHNGEEVLAAIDLTDITNPIDVASKTWRHPAADDGLSLLHDLIPYEGFLFFMHNNSFYKMDATTMTLTGGFVIKDPCNIGLSARNGVSLKLVTYGQTVHGPLNAFVLYGNTTNATNAEFTLCRVNHMTGNQEWIYTVADDFAIEDITGGAESVMLITGYSPLTLKVSTLVMNILTGASYGFMRRDELDYGKFPLFVPSNIVKPSNDTLLCGPAFLLQVKGSLNAYCVTPFMVYNQPIAPAWLSGIPFAFTPAFDPASAYVLGATAGHLWALEASTGFPIWSVASQNTYESGPQIVSDNGTSYVFVADWESTLWGFEITLSISKAD